MKSTFKLERCWGYSVWLEKQTKEVPGLTAKSHGLRVQNAKIITLGTKWRTFFSLRHAQTEQMLSLWNEAPFPYILPASGLRSWVSFEPIRPIRTVDSAEQEICSQSETRMDLLYLQRVRIKEHQWERVIRSAAFLLRNQVTRFSLANRNLLSGQPIAMLRICPQWPWQPIGIRETQPPLNSLLFRLCLCNLVECWAEAVI